jgi:hypothetical protein
MKRDNIPIVELAFAAWKEREKLSKKNIYMYTLAYRFKKMMEVGTPRAKRNSLRIIRSVIKIIKIIKTEINKKTTI